jgi:hypothetical protein
VWQYGVTGGTVGASCVVGEAPRQATDADVRAQIRSLQRQGCLPPFTPRRLFLVFTKQIQFPNYGAPPPDGFCAYHDQCGPGQYYALCPFPAIGGCGAGSPLGSWESLTCHEILEAATDPSGSGGWTAHNEEGADFCNWQEVTLPFGTVQRFEDNQQHACSVFTTANVISDRVEHGVLGDVGPIAPGETRWYTAWEEADAAFGKLRLFTAAPLPRTGRGGAQAVQITDVQSMPRETGGRHVTVTVRNPGPQDLHARIFYTRSVAPARLRRRTTSGQGAELEQGVFGEVGPIPPGGTGWYTTWDEADAAFGKVSLFTAVPLPHPTRGGAQAVQITDVRSMPRETGGRHVTVTVRNTGSQDLHARIFYARVDSGRSDG